MSTIVSSNSQSPTIFVIFGVTGDLARKKLIHALFDLYLKKLLQEKFRVVGFARSPHTKDDFQALIRDMIHATKIGCCQNPYGARGCLKHCVCLMKHGCGQT